MGENDKYLANDYDGSSDRLWSEGDDVFFSNVDDDDFEEGKDKNVIVKEVVVEGEEDVVNSEKHDTCEDGGEEDMYQDLDNPGSPKSDIEEENDGNKQRKKRKRKVKYPRYHSTSSTDLVVGMTSRDKKQLKNAIEDYRIMGGYHLKMKETDKCGIQMCCMGEGCKWRLWALKLSNEAS